jgi:hypothetical protein
MRSHFYTCSHQDLKILHYVLQVCENPVLELAQGYCPCSPRSTCSTLSKPSSVDGLVRNGGFKIKTEFKLTMCENEKKECSKL